jgi:dipeptidyl aminopeptidase/acylaminoacyl peptidase
MTRRFVLLAALLIGCTSPSAGVATSSPTAAATVAPTPTLTPSATSSAAPSPGARVFAGAGLETYFLGRLTGEIALVIRPMQPKGDPNSATEYRELWAVPLDGRPAMLAVRFRTPKDNSTLDANLLDRQLSPDGKRVVLSVGIGEIEVASQLEVIELETGRLTPLFPGSALAFDDMYPAWSPDGALVAFVRWPHPGNGVSLREIWVVGADGRNARRVRPAVGPGTFVRLFGWLPDSRRIAFDPVNFEESALAIIDIDGVERARRVERLAGDSAGMPISLRSQRPVLAMATVDSPFNPTSYDLAVADDIGATARVVASVKPNATTGELGLAAARWDPSGANQILYRVTGVASTTVVLDLDTGTAVRIGSRVRVAAWSPDGKRVVTIEEHPSTANDALYVWARDGTLVRERLGLPGDPLIYRLTDLAVRSY